MIDNDRPFRSSSLMMKEIVRRINYFTAAFTGILGLSLASEIFKEDDVSDKIDDFVFLLLAIFAIWWYKKMGFRESKTTTSLVILGVGILTKVGAIIVEHADAEAVGDDIGIVIGLFIAFGFVLWQTISLRKLK